MQNYDDYFIIVLFFFFDKLISIPSLRKIQYFHDTIDERRRSHESFTNYRTKSDESTTRLPDSFDHPLQEAPRIVI